MGGLSVKGVVGDQDVTVGDGVLCVAGRLLGLHGAYSWGGLGRLLLALPPATAAA